MSDTDHLHPEHPSSYEKRDANVTGIAIIAFAVIALIIIFAVLLDDFFVQTREELIYKAAQAPATLEQVEMDAHNDSLLTTYGVIDTTKGIYHIPIDRAMDIIAIDSDTDSEEDRR